MKTVMRAHKNNNINLKSYVVLLTPCIPSFFPAFALYAAPFLLQSHFCPACLYLLSLNSSPSSQASPCCPHRGSWPPVTAAVCVLHAWSSVDTQESEGKTKGGYLVSSSCVIPPGQLVSLPPALV